MFFFDDEEIERGEAEQDKTQFNVLLLYSIYIPLWYNVDTILSR